MLSNSESASKCLSFVHDGEPGRQDGVYIGKTQIYKRPFFLDTSALLNPHLTAIGMTGSGKTYFLKSYIIRNRLLKGSDIFIIDWNGEYDETVDFLGGTVARVAGEEEAQGAEIAQLLCGVSSISLARLSDDAKRKRAACAIMERLIETMHSMPISSIRNRIVLLDEAWKMLGENRNLGRIFREGRKYGFNVVVATQLVRDVNNEMLANSGSVFVFRLQNDDDCGVLVDAGIASGGQKELLPNLGIGSCLVHLAQKDEAAAGSFFVRKIDGFKTSVYTIKGDHMQFIKITNEEFQKVTERFLPLEARAAVSNYVEANDRNVDLIGLSRFLMKCGIKRPGAVVYLRSLGIGDPDIVKAYERALEMKELK